MCIMYIYTYNMHTHANDINHCFFYKCAIYKETFIYIFQKEEYCTYVYYIVKDLMILNVKSTAFLFIYFLFN